MRVAGVFRIPARSPTSSGGVAGWNRGGRGARSFVYSRFRSSLCLASVAYGIMPSLSSPSASSSSVRWSPSTPQVSYPWRMAAAGGGLGLCSSNKLEGRLIHEKLVAISSLFLCCRGGRREVVGEFVRNFFRSVVASETGLWRRIRGKYSCPVLCSSSATFCGEATVPSSVLALRWLAAGLDRSVADCSGRRAALWSSSALWRRLISFLPAMVPTGRHFAFGSAFVSSSTGACWRRSDGEASSPSGCVPGFGVLGPQSRQGRRWT